ncbi:MAG: glycosyltransferase [Paludisphaera borealis]|uniref:glycosyltransferase n=1 Tax=Paludisphaera borealis TaxID=1387353 RepID=UPI00284472E2|nr:glycosyltransferase [Paludisphaera borealis]MDR3621635.1 glycosyltransferase [Paludisphaera borealis]
MLKLSIAMASYNGGRFLQEQLDSIARQSRPPDELVVCDDGSSDDTMDILNQFQGRASFPIEIQRNERQLGYAKNFEKVMGLCRGDLIFPCDQDDVWHETKLHKHETIYNNETDVGMIYNNSRYIDVDSRLMDGTVFERSFCRNPQMFETLQSDQAFIVLARNWRVSGCMTSFRARFWDAITPIPGELNHDDWVAICMSLLSRIRLIAEPLNDYRQHSNQATKATEQSDAATSSFYVPVFTRLMEQRATELAQVKLRLKKLESSHPALRFPSHQDHLKGLMSHLWRRSSMSNKLLRRLPLILTELLLNNYARYNDNLRDCLSQDIRQRRFQ